MPRRRCAHGPEQHAVQSLAVVRRFEDRSLEGGIAADAGFPSDLGTPPLLSGSRRVGPTQAVGRRPAAVGICRRGVDSRGRLPRSGRGRLQVVWRLQADAGDSLRLVGHMALRSTLSSSGPRMPGGGGPE